LQELSFKTVILFGCGLILLYILGRFLLVPFKSILKLLFNSLLGAAAIALINLAGGIFLIHIALTPVNAFIVGFFGLPGVVLLLLIRLIFL